MIAGQDMFMGTVVARMLWSNKPPLALIAGQEEMVPGSLYGQEPMAGELIASKDEFITAALLNGHSILNQNLNT